MNAAIFGNKHMESWEDRARGYLILKHAEIHRQIHKFIDWSFSMLSI